MKSYYGFKGIKVDTVPDDFTPYTDDSKDYPDGVDGNTVVSVAIRYEGQTFLYTGQAQSFGWSIEPAAPCWPGLQSIAAPITHYKIGEMPNKEEV